MPDQLHPVARCRWCQQSFKLIHLSQWICTTDECAEKQIAHAILKHNTTEDSESPYLFLPLPLQVDIEESQVKRLLVHGAVGVSKSYGGRWHLYKRCLSIKGYRALLLRCTLKQLEINHLQFMEAEANALGGGEVCEYKGGNVREMRFVNGSRIYMGYCEDDADIAQHRGPEWDEVLMEEAVNFLPRAIEQITARDRGSSTARAAMYARGVYEGRSRLLTNPDGRASEFLRTLYIDKNPDQKDYKEYEPEFYGAIVGDVRDNPYLSPTFKKSVLGGLNSDAYEQLAEGRWDVNPNRFFKTWEPNRVLAGTS